MRDSPGSGPRDALRFPVDDYSVGHVTVPTSAGDRQVKYHWYRHVSYVAQPVDVDYQSLDVRVPVEIDGVAADASEAPILLANSVGGFMSVNNRSGDLRGPRGEGTVGGRHVELALAGGYVAVWPGVRGRDNRAADGTYFGKAPAAIVDLKAAVRYLRHNRGLLPGDAERIVSTGCSAGGGLSALLGASGNSPLYDEYLREIGAADERDDIWAASCYSPITDLDHADMAYEWVYGPSLQNQSGQQVDQTLSAELRDLFPAYQRSLGLEGRDGSGPLTADNLGEYLVRHYLVPSATRFLMALSEGEREDYLSVRDWMDWNGERADFSFEDYQRHCGRWKGVPSFDDLELKLSEPSLFGDASTEARHFTEFGLRKATGDPDAELEPEVRRLVDLMNPMHFVLSENPGCAQCWWLRRGTGETGISPTAIVNLATGLEQTDRKVDTWLFWDAAHCIDEDAEGFISWMGEVTHA